LEKKLFMETNPNTPLPDNTETVPGENELEQRLKVKELQNRILKKILEEKEQDLKTPPTEDIKKHQ